ncbi:hypothetical protein PT974_02525 [Cladobotryum mycophilum]|uniref:Uncharacterized protein n=1 Tax=Cladobotryum mycophilum TaxID=491253 RepID=A0ABR0SZ57_9HYPO
MGEDRDPMGYDVVAQEVGSASVPRQRQTKARGKPFCSFV